MIVYLDLLLLVNVLLNVWNLWLTAKLAGLTYRPISLFCAGFCGAFYILSFLSPWSEQFAHPLIKLLSAAGMLFIAFRPSGGARLLRLLAWFLFACFLTAGSIYGLHTFFDRKLLSGSGLILGDLRFYTMAMAALVLVFVGRHFMGSLENRFVRSANSAQLTIVIGSLNFQLKALVDTGNQLFEPLNQRPVVVADLNSISHLLPPPLQSLTDDCQNLHLERLSQVGLDSDWLRRINFIPYHAVSQRGGVLLGVRADLVEIRSEGQVQAVRNIVLALSPSPLSTNGHYQALVPLRLLPLQAAA